MRLWVILSVMTVSVAGWHCGIGAVSGAISYLIAFPSDMDGVNKCCEVHDREMENASISAVVADGKFCRCLYDNDRWYVRNVVRPIFCASVAIYTTYTRREYYNEYEYNRGYNNRNYRNYRYSQY